MRAISSIERTQLADVVGGQAVNLPLSGDVSQNINTNWGGTQNITINQAPAAVKPSGLRFEYLQQHPEARFGSPPYKAKHPR
jgi:hypothetical protein